MNVPPGDITSRDGIANGSSTLPVLTTRRDDAWLVPVDEPGDLVVPASLVSAVVAAEATGVLAVVECAAVARYAFGEAQKITQVTRDRLFALADTPPMEYRHPECAGHLCVSCGLQPPQPHGDKPGTFCTDCLWAGHRRQTAARAERDRLDRTIAGKERAIVDSANLAMPRHVHKAQLTRAREASRGAEQEWWNAVETIERLKLRPLPAHIAETLAEAQKRNSAGAVQAVFSAYFKAESGYDAADVRRLKMVLAQLDRLSSDLSSAWSERLGRECMGRRKRVPIPQRLCSWCYAPLTVDPTDVSDDDVECSACTKDTFFARDLDWGWRCVWCRRCFIAPEYPTDKVDDAFSIFCSPHCALVTAIDLDDFTTMLDRWPLVHYLPPYPRTLRERRRGGLAMAALKIQWAPVMPDDPRPRGTICSNVPQWGQSVLPAAEFSNVKTKRFTAKALPARQECPAAVGRTDLSTSRPDRLLAALDTLGEATAKEIATQIGVSPRTTRRGLDKLLGAGCVWRSTRGSASDPYHYRSTRIGDGHGQRVGQCLSNE